MRPEIYFLTKKNIWISSKHPVTAERDTLSHIIISKIFVVDNIALHKLYLLWITLHCINYICCGQHCIVQIIVDIS